MSDETSRASQTSSCEFDAYIFDLDGTVYLSDTLLPTSRDTIAELRDRGKRVLFLSNNPTRSRQEYAEKLTSLGIPTTHRDIINSSWVMTRYLQREAPAARVFVVGEESLCRELVQGGIRLSEEADEIDVVVASFDRSFSYRKLQIAFDAVRRGARFFATNSDAYCPVPGGGLPDAAAVIAAIEACTKRPVEVVVGKPSRHMIEAVLDAAGIPAEKCLMVGDRIETDIAMGHDAGMATALTLTGVTDRPMATAAEIRPTFIISNLAELLSLPLDGERAR